MSRMWSQAPPERAEWAARAHAVRVEDELARARLPFLDEASAQ